MVDKTDNDTLENLKKIYKDQIVDYKYKVWKEPYLSKPSKNAFCTGITRYRTCMKVTHIILKDGRYIPVSGNGVTNNDTDGCLMVFLFIVFIFLLLLCIR